MDKNCVNCLVTVEQADNLLKTPFPRDQVVERQVDNLNRYLRLQHLFISNPDNKHQSLDHSSTNGGRSSLRDLIRTHIVFAVAKTFDDLPRIRFVLERAQQQQNHVK
ncbi:hypothetical protein GEMRC1_006727 [Eukaryota sp. GEM-RC1]